MYSIKRSCVSILEHAATKKQNLLSLRDPLHVLYFRLDICDRIGGIDILEISDALTSKKVDTHLIINKILAFLKNKPWVFIVYQALIISPNKYDMNKEPYTIFQKGILSLVQA